MPSVAQLIQQTENDKDRNVKYIPTINHSEQMIREYTKMCVNQAKKWV